MTQRKETYEVHALRQIVMVEGWQAVYWMHNKHEALPLHALGLGTSNTHACRSNEIIRSYGYTPEEEWAIFGLEYSLGDGWNISESASNFCGLLPPGETLASWEEYGPCASRHEKETPA